MDREELRAHLRVPTRRKAILHLADGTRVRCLLLDVSMGGAYLVRRVVSGAHRITPGEMLELELLGEEGEPVARVHVEVIRREPDGGPGLAVRFHVSSAARAPVVDFVHLQARAAGISPQALGRPAITGGAMLLRSAGLLWKLLLCGAIAAGAWGWHVANDWLASAL